MNLLQYVVISTVNQQTDKRVKYNICILYYKIVSAFTSNWGYTSRILRCSSVTCRTRNDGDLLGWLHEYIPFTYTSIRNQLDAKCPLSWLATNFTFKVMVTHTRTHYIDVIMTTMASQITSLTVVYSTVNSDEDQRKHQSSASLAFVWGGHWPGPVNSPHKGPVRRKMFPFDDVIKFSFWSTLAAGTYLLTTQSHQQAQFWQ